MEIVSLHQKYSQPIVVCLGFFDCMHQGHTQLLSRAKNIAAMQKNARVALFTFSNNHFKTLNRPTSLIYTFDERVDIYQSLGVDVVVTAQFDKAFMGLCGAEFLRELSENFPLKGVVCGEDFTCGSDLFSAFSVAKFFENICPVSVEKLVKTTDGGEKICSSFVRKLLSENNLSLANGFLSEPFFFKGVVQSGRQQGTNLGFPTANLAIPDEKLTPCGVYLGYTTVDGKQYKSIVNVGDKPTYMCREISLETHLLDYCGDLYGKEIKVSLVQYLRKIEKFDSPTQLAEQLKRDVEKWG